jgi:hypothetical protein
MIVDPVLIAYTVSYSKTSDRFFWTRVGAAYPHATGAGLTVILDAVPTDGRIVLLELDEEDDKRLVREARARRKANRKQRTQPAG